MNAAELCLSSASEIARAIREGRVGSRAMLDAYLARVERLNPRINAVVATDLDGARKRADEADAAIARGESWGPLHGVPTTIKDGIEVVGMPTTAGAPAFRKHMPKANAPSAQRLIDAGAVVFGKTNVPLFLQDFQSYNPVYGCTNNPWDVSRSPGGSSGGSAAALAAGMTGLELGSDIGGSLRNPAHWCGVYSHKPSWGIVPSRGHIPGPPGTLGRSDLATIGPMARSAEDLALALSLVAGPDVLDAAGWKLALPACEKPLKDFRVLAWLEDGSCPVDAEVSTPLNNMVDTLRRQGVAVETAAPAGMKLREQYDLYLKLLTAAFSAGVPPKMFARMRHMAWFTSLFRKPALDELPGYAGGITQRHRDWVIANEMRERLRWKWADLFARYDVVLMPVVPVTALKHLHEGNLFSRKITVNGQARPYADLMAWIAPPTLSYLPVTIAPVGLSPGGLPVGVQVVGSFLGDRATIQFAQELARVLPPPVWNEARLG